MDDGRLASALLTERLVGRGVPRVSIAYSVTLEFAEPPAIPDSRLTFESPFVHAASDGLETVINPEELNDGAREVVAILRAKVAAASVRDDGSIALTFDDGRALHVEKPDGPYEHDRALVVCLPSGGLDEGSRCAR